MRWQEYYAKTKELNERLQKEQEKTAAMQHSLAEKALQLQSSNEGEALLERLGEELGQAPILVRIGEEVVQIRRELTELKEEMGKKEERQKEREKEREEREREREKEREWREKERESQREQKERPSWRMVLVVGVPFMVVTLLLGHWLR